MIPKFVPTNRDQQYLFPPSIQDWLSEEHLARFVVDIVSQLNLQPLSEAYAGKGFKAYHPEILLSLLFYGYAQRKSTIEPVFGIIKRVLGFRQFFLRGLEAVSGEWTLMSIAWNIKRMFALNS